MMISGAPGMDTLCDRNLNDLETEKRKKMKRVRRREKE